MPDWLRQFVDDDIIRIPQRRGKLHKGQPCEVISVKITGEMRQRLAEIVESNIDPEIRVYADIVRDALDKWIVDWDAEESRFNSPEAQRYRSDRIQSELEQFQRQKQANEGFIENLEEQITLAQRSHDTAAMETLSGIAWKMAVQYHKTDTVFVKRLCEIFPIGQNR